MAYIIPSACGIVINLKYTRDISSLVIQSVVCLIGIIVSISGIVSIIHKIIKGYECSHGIEMPYCNSNGVFQNTFASSNFTFIYSINSTVNNTVF